MRGKKSRRARVIARAPSGVTAQPRLVPSIPWPGTASTVQPSWFRNASSRPTKNASQCRAFPVLPFPGRRGRGEGTVRGQNKRRTASFPSSLYKKLVSRPGAGERPGAGLSRLSNNSTDHLPGIRDVPQGSSIGGLARKRRPNYLGAEFSTLNVSASNASGFFPNPLVLSSNSFRVAKGKGGKNQPKQKTTGSGEERRWVGRQYPP